MSSVQHVYRFIVVSVRERGGGRRRGGHSRTLEGAQRVAPSVCFGAVQRDSFLQRGGHLVQFFKVLGQPRAEHGGAEFQVVVRVGVCEWGTCGVHGAAGADDGAILGHVDAAVDVGVAVEGGGEAAALGLRHAVLAGGAGLVFSVHHQLDPTFSTALLDKRTNSMWLDV